VQEDGLKPPIIKAQSYTEEEYADDYEGNPYPHRYSLASFRKAGFEVRYGDCRDVGYVASWREFMGKVDGSMGRHQELKVVTECFVPSVLCELFGDSDDAVSENDTARDKDNNSWPEHGQ
jgi:hypothetical protein